MNNLLFANIPHNCNDDDLRTWIEARGFKVTGLQLIRDTVSGSSPSFARVELAMVSHDGAVRDLDQQPLGDRRVCVRSGPPFRISEPMQ